MLLELLATVLPPVLRGTKGLEPPIFQLMPPAYGPWALGRPAALAALPTPDPAFGP
jgi:hypothetical protein